jgi:hypothetical protein
MSKKAEEELKNLLPVYSAQLIENLKILKKLQDCTDNKEHLKLKFEYETAKKISEELRKRIEELLELTK